MGFVFRFRALCGRDVHEWYEKIKDKVDVVAKPFVTPPTRDKEEKRYCFTFKDPEGNHLQFMTGK